eukprot:s104_g21.t1
MFENSWQMLTPQDTGEGRISYIGSQPGALSRAKLCRGYALRFGAAGVVFAMSLFLFFASQASIVVVDCWLARWSALPVQGDSETSANLLVFVFLAMLAAVIVTLQAASWPLLCLRASSRLHSDGLWCVLRAPMDVALASVPGQLLSRFAKDLDCLDTRLPALLAQALTCVAALFSALTAIVVSSPALAPMAVALALVMWRLAAAYSPVASDAARLVSIFNGPVVAHLMECLEGRAYLRSFGQSDDAMRHALAVLEVNARSQVLNAKYLVNYATRALAQFASVERLLTLSALQAEEARRRTMISGMTGDRLRRIEAARRDTDGHAVSMITSGSESSPLTTCEPHLQPVMDEETMAGPGQGGTGGASPSQPAPSDHSKFLKDMYSRSEEIITQELRKDPVAMHRLYLALSILAVASCVAYLRHGTLEAVICVLLGSALTAGICWLALFLTNLLADLLEKLSKSGSAYRGLERGQETTTRSAGKRRCYGIPTSALLVLWAAAGCLPGVMLAPMSRTYFLSTILVILCGVSLTFLIGIRDPLCNLLPCEPNSH